MKPHQESRDKVFSFSLEEVSSTSTKADAENTPEGGQETPEVVLPSEEELAEIRAKIEAEAREKGFAEGEQAGHDFGMKKLAPLEQSLLSLTTEMQDLKVRLLKECEEDILAMVLAIVRRILGHDVEITPEIILGYMTKGMQKIGEEKRVLVRLHPQDIEAATKASDQLSVLLESEGRFRFEPDATLSQGDCIIEGRERVIDARPKIQLALFEAALMGGDKPR